MRAVQLTAFGNAFDGLSMSTFASPTLPAPTRSSSASSFPPSTRTTSWSPRASMHTAPRFRRQFVFSADQRPRHFSHYDSRRSNAPSKPAATGVRAPFIIDG